MSESNDSVNVHKDTLATYDSEKKNNKIDSIQEKHLGYISFLL